MYRFGPFTLTVDDRRLSVGSDTLRLSPKAFDLLAVFVQHSQRLLSKHELLARVWPDVFVEEGILTVHVSALRKALDDRSRHPRYIETVSGSGYRFVAAVTRDEPQAHPPLIDPPRPIALYELLGRGRVHVLSGSHTKLSHAVDAFQAAIALDPTYAPAHAALARVRCMQAVFHMVSPQAAFAEARTSAIHALALDETSADAHLALGMVQFYAEWDWSGAERSLQRALQLSPDHTEALLQYGSLHEALGRLDEGLRFKQRALERDPDSPMVLIRIAQSYAGQRNYDEALAWANRALEIDSINLAAGVFIAAVYWMTGNIDGFIALRTRTEIARGASDEAMSAWNRTAVRMRQAYAARGHAGWSEFTADEISMARLSAVPPGAEASSSSSARDLAMLYGAAGRLEQAFTHLNEAIAIRDPGVVYLGFSPPWDPLRADPRFEACLRRLGLPTVPRPATTARPG